MNNVFVYCEIEGTQVQEVSQELLTKGRKLANQLGVGEFKQLAEETRAFLRQDVRNTASATNAQLTEIMMAQDFHDLTGQVIAKVVTLASSLENQLVELLVQTAPAGAVLPAAPAQPPAPPVPEAVDAEDVWAAALAEGQPIAHPQLNGPVVDPASTPNVVSSQSEVDDLLASLGF